MSRDRTPTNIEVTPLDFSEREADALEVVRKTYPDATHVNFEKVGIVRTNEGIFALCTEGVGSADPISEDNPLIVDVSHETRNPDGKGGTFGAMPCVTLSLDAEGAEQYATGEPVNLAEFVRTFGNRLHQNYEGWRRTLEAATQEEVAV